MILVTADVESLYTSIRHEDGIEAVRLFLGMSNWDSQTCDLIVDLLKYILTHNLFVFRDVFYLQKQGTAMGAACAPSYANLFLGAWERQVLHGGGAHAVDHVQCWLRYIDDILFILQGTEELLLGFMQELNVNDRNIKLTYVADAHKVNFLDISIEADTNGMLQMDVFRKETSTNSLLHATSAHVHSTFKAVPVGQFLRMRRICSSDASFERQARDLKSRFQERGYSNRCIKNGYRRAKNIDRMTLLHPAKTGTKDKNVVRFISTFNNQWETMQSILKKHWPVLQTEHAFSTSLPKKRQMTARRSKNLKDILIKSHYVPKQIHLFSTRGPIQGCYPCGDCVACVNVVRSTTFTSTGGERTFKILDYI
ncbi:uncharacterized protein LOC142760596 [Rhinoderma darwinii]|uniref:uncharacterized protein LOC142760596 n=1 Tax=Rhinoderma darwinii TaxID=43563 RepID=UPI003F66228E